MNKLVIIICVLILFGCSREEYKYSTNSPTRVDATLVDNQIIFESDDGIRQFLYASCIEAQNGDFLATFMNTRHNNDVAQGGRIEMAKSSDNGKTWSEPFIIQKNIGELNIASPTLIEIDDCKLFLFFAAKESTREINLYFKESNDCGVSWSEPSMINEPNTGYHIINNDRVKFHNGRLWMPIAKVDGDIYEEYDDQRVFCFYSDDLGKTWDKTEDIKANFALMEPGITFLGDEEIIMNIRTKKGFVYFARSDDYGNSWRLDKSEVPSPASPQTISRYNESQDTLIMVWNNNTEPQSGSVGNRSPLTVALSTTGGASWNKLLDLEGYDSDFDFSYPAIIAKDSLFYIFYNQVTIADTRKARLKMATISLKKE